MNKIFNSFNPLVIGVRTNKEPVFVAFLYAILNSCSFLITSLTTLNKQLFHATVAFLCAINSLIDSLIDGLFSINKQVIRGVDNSLDAVLNSMGFVISSLVRIIRQFISAVLNSCSFVITSLFRIKKQFMHGVAFFSIAIVSSSVSSSGFIIDSLIRINKQVISGVVNGILSSFGTIVSFFVSFWGTILASLGAVINSFSAGTIILGAVIAAVLASLVRINKKLINGVVCGVVNSLNAILNSMGFVISGLVRLIRQVLLAPLAFLRFVIIGIFKIIKQVIHMISASLRKIITSLRFVTGSIFKSGRDKQMRGKQTGNKQIVIKILTWGIFVVVSLIVIAAFVTATTYIQLAVAIILYPPLVYFSFKVFPRKARSFPSRKPVTAIQSQSQVQSAEKAEPGKRENISITDIDKRAFLKMIGGTGLILFVMSIFNKNAGGLFPGIAPAGSGLTLLKDTAGNTINPAQNQPLDGYRISEVDDNIIAFYGFINKDGAWFIMKGDEDTGSFRYARGNSDFPNNWARRENLQYDYFYKLF